jgi:2-polyprenyl-3-methyl-5-hydroxy-6-metoxy-1,4-benzoquinol methylase
VPSTPSNNPSAFACRVCGHALFPESLLRYAGMPKAAQYLPGAEDLIEDLGLDLEVRQCSGCGLVQLGNEPVPYFREVIRAAGFSDEMKAFRRDQFRNFIQEHTLQRKQILEVGCGRGEYLSILHELDVKATGLEYAEASVASASQHGLHVLQGFFSGDGQLLPSAPYDAFLMFSFLEHLPDPNGTLRTIRANLSEEGVGIVEVPNFDMILSKDLFSEFIGDHLFYFTQDTLKATLTRNGFEVLRCEEVWHNYILSATVRKRQKLDLSRFDTRQEQLKAELEAFINRFSPRQVAVWGAGHQALAVLALADLGGKLKYIIDSAPFKQGRFTPATHLPIVSPETLDSDPVEGIIVMAASYSDEVARILLSRHPGRFQICVLREHGLEMIESLLRT